VGPSQSSGSREARIEALFQKRSGLLRSLVEHLFGFRVGIERLALLDADRFELIDNGAIARDPRLVLHDAVDILEETRVVLNCGIEHDIGGIDNAVSGGWSACDNGWSLTRLP
jgi:hypothetical protein